MRKKERVSVSKTQKINPADARAGIDPTKLAMASTAQRTPTKEETRQFQVTGRSTAQQERLRATRRSQGSPLQARSDARNVRRGFNSGDVPLRPPVVDDTGFSSMGQQQDPTQGTVFDTTDPFGQQQEGFSQFQEPVRERLGLSDPSGAVFGEGGKRGVQTNVPTYMDLLDYGATAQTGVGGFGSLGTKSAGAVGSVGGKISSQRAEALKEIERWESFHAGGKKITDKALQQLEVLIAKAGGVGENTALKEISRWESFHAGGKEITDEALNHLDKLTKRAIEIEESRIIKALKGAKTLANIDEVTAVTAEEIISTQGLTTPAAAQSAAGRLTYAKQYTPKGYGLVSHRIVADPIKVRGGHINNVYEVRKQLSILQKIAKLYKKHAALVLTALSGYVFSVGLSFNEGQGDVIQALGTGYNKLDKDDIQTKAEYKERMDAVWSASNIAQNFIPFLGNFILADKRKVDAQNFVVHKNFEKDRKRLEKLEAGESYGLTTTEKAKREEFEANQDKRRAESDELFQANLANTRAGNPLTSGGIATDEQLRQRNLEAKKRKEESR